MIKHSNKAFTFIELQVALVVLLSALLAVRILIINYSKQLSWLENSSTFKTYINSTYNRIAFTEIYTPDNSIKTYNLNVTTMTYTTTNGNILSAEVELLDVE